MLKMLTFAAAVIGSLAVPLTAGAQTLRFGHANSPGEVANDMFNEFAERVNKRTNGAMTIRVFPSEQLGKEADLVQQVKTGALDISAPSMPVMSSLVPAMEMASGPFLWKDWKEAETVLRGPAFEHLKAVVRHKQGMRGLVEPVVRTPDALDEPRGTLGSAHLYHEVDLAPINAEIER